MQGTLPHGLLFSLTIPVYPLGEGLGGGSREIPAAKQRSRKDGHSALGLTAEHRIHGLEVFSATQPWATCQLGWNSQGLALRINVAGRPETPVDKPDRAVLCINTRNTQAVSRATRFCHTFRVESTANKARLKIQRDVPPSAAAAAAGAKAASSPPPPVRGERLELPDGYAFEIWFEAASLPGYDPRECPLLGFAYRVEDAVLGVQHLTLDDTLPVSYNPSLWQRLELIGADSQ